jgi:hypothetical protein
MPTDLEKKTAQAIVNIFETGSAQGNMGALPCCRVTRVI